MYLNPKIECFLPPKSLKCIPGPGEMAVPTLAGSVEALAAWVYPGFGGQEIGR